MPAEIHCPNCPSENVIFSKKRGVHVCEDCGHEFTPEKPFVPQRIFLSYGHDEHISLAIHLRDDLRNRKHTVWFDEERLQPGHDWEAFIEKGLEHLAADKANAAVILLLTPHSVRRPDGYCLNEVARALSRGLRIIPLMVVESEPPLSICRIQWLDMRQCLPIHEKEAFYRPRFERLLKALEENQLDFEGTQQRLLKALQPLEFDADILRHLPKFTGRRWVFEAVQRWLKDPSMQRVFWICGGPGFGKTALSAVLSSRYLEVAALHLCKFGHGQKSDPRRVVTSIVYQLTTQLPEYQARLATMDIEALVRDGDGNSAATMFDNLLVQPLAKLNQPGRAIIILIDALDEATRNEWNALADFISREFDKTPKWLRLIITSRRDSAVETPLQGLDPFVLDTDIEENRSDICDYLKTRLAPQLDGRTDAHRIVEQILSKSNGVILYAERVCHDVQLGFLSLDRVEEFPRGLGEVFCHFCNRLVWIHDELNPRPDYERYRREFRPALRVILAALEPLPISILQTLFGWKEDELQDFIRSLGSLFPVSNEGSAAVIKPCHTSLAEWLATETKAGPFYASVMEGQHELAGVCWANYRRNGAAAMDTYALRHTRTHLRQIEAWDKLDQLEKDEDYLRQTRGEPFGQRQMRIWISSSFRDMMRERDLLVKQVFPRLRKKCAARFITLTEVDLRWGITEEQASEGKVLPLVLAEIDRCRPFFLGLLGERYGWIPDTIPPEVIEREPWLKEHLQGNTSIIELEILHGVLNSPRMQNHAFFYFRDPAYATNSALADDERLDMFEHDIQSEVVRYGQAEAARRTEQRKAKLAALKQRIRSSKVSLVEPYANPEHLAEVVYKQFDELIDRLYPEDQVPNPLAQERMAQEAHAKNRLFACIDRPEHLAALNAFAASPECDGKGIVVTGESGSGKTVLLAAWARDWVTNHPEDFVFQHYFGATADSVSPEGFLLRLLGELKSRFGITDDIPTAPEKLRDVLPQWLIQIIGRGRVVILMDGLDQVQGSETDRHLGFLPQHFPQQVVMLASALPGPVLEALRQRGWVEHNLPQANEAEVGAMVGAYLSIHARTLEPGLRHQLVTAPSTKNPLFLRTVLEELRQFGSFEQLPQRMRHYLEADNPKDLFLLVLRHWQEDFDGNDSQKDKPNFDLVRRALTHLWAARCGLSGDEWLDLLSCKNERLKRELWTPFFLALEPHLNQRGGLFTFGHDFMRQAVEGAFTPSGELQQAAHLSVADYFENDGHQREMSPRKASEWPWQLHAARAWDRLEVCLTHIPLFLALYNDRTKWELAGYWHPLRSLGRDMGSCYANALQCALRADSQLDRRIIQQLGSFLLENGCYQVAESMLHEALELREQELGPEHPDTLESMNSLAGLLASKGDYAAAEPLFRRALEASERALGSEHPSMLAYASNMAELLMRKGDYAGAEPLCRRALEARERILGSEDSSTLASLNNLAFLLASKGDYAGAEPLYRRALEAQQRVLGPEHPATLASANDLAVLLASKGDYAVAEPLYRRALEARERVLGSEHPSTLASLNNLAFLLASKGDYVGAEPLYRRALESQERVLGPEHPDTLASVSNLALLLASKGDYVGAEPLLRKALETSERILGSDHPNSLNSLNSLAELLTRKGDYAGAEWLYRRTLEARERVLGAEHPDTLTTMEHLTGILEGLGRTDEARLLRQRCVALVTAKLDTPPITVRRLALDCFRVGDYATAEDLLKRLLQSGFEPPGPLHHLIRLCLITDRFSEARMHLAEALTSHTEAKPYILARLHWFQLALEMLSESEVVERTLNAELILGRLKTALQNDDAFMEWTMSPVLEHLRVKLSEAEHALLATLIAALNNRAKLPDLDQFPEWRNATPRPLD